MGDEQYRLHLPVLQLYTRRPKTLASRINLDVVKGVQPEDSSLLPTSVLGHALQPRRQCHHQLLLTHTDYGCPSASFRGVCSILRNHHNRLMMTLRCPHEVVIKIGDEPLLRFLSYRLFVL